jgi:phenylalanyl-tRNA synthetase beta chain
LRVTTPRAERAWLHPGRSAAIVVDGRNAGWIGELHPRLVRHFELPSAPLVFEVDVDALATVPLPVGRPVSRLPVVRRDLAIVVDDGCACTDPRRRPGGRAGPVCRHDPPV